MAVPPSFSAAAMTAAGSRAAGLEIGAHVALLQGPEIAARGAQCNRLPGVEAMPARHAPGGDAEDLARHDGVAVQHDDPVHGPHELGLAVAPAHASRDRKRIERRLDDAGQELGGGLARPRGPAEQGLAPVVADARELLDLDATGLGEGACGARRLARGIESGGYRRAATLDALLRLPVEELAHADCEAAWREPGLGRAVREACGLETRDDAGAEGLAERGEALGRHLLRADFDQEIVAVHLGRFFMRTVASPSEADSPPAAST